MWQTILNYLIGIITVIFAIAFFIGTQKLYHHFWSLADAVHESNFSYWVKRLVASIIFAGIGAYIGVYVGTAVAMFMGLKVEEKKPATVIESPQSQSNNETPRLEQTTNLNPATNNQQNSTEEKYDGDDPVIRERLGLPPKN